MNLHHLATEIHRQNVDAGWWNDWFDKAERYETAMCLVVTELAEAAEGSRRNLMDDHLPHHKMVHVEIADAAIRLLDLAGAYHVMLAGQRFDEQVEGSLDVLKQAPNDLAAIYCVMQSAAIITDRRVSVIRVSLAAVVAFSKLKDFDLWSIVEEKRAYNRTRADHKPIARAGEHGKRF